MTHTNQECVRSEASKPVNWNPLVYEESQQTKSEVAFTLQSVNMETKWHVPLLHMLFRTGRDKPCLSEWRKSQPLEERRNTCVISSNSSVVEWQEQVCSTVLLSEHIKWSKSTMLQSYQKQVSLLCIQYTTTWKELAEWHSMWCNSTEALWCKKAPLKMHVTFVGKVIHFWSYELIPGTKMGRKPQMCCHLANNNNIYTLALIGLSKIQPTHCSVNIKHVVS